MWLLIISFIYNSLALASDFCLVTLPIIAGIDPTPLSNIYLLFLHMYFTFCATIHFILIIYMVAVFCHSSYVYMTGFAKTITNPIRTEIQFIAEH